MAKKESLGLGKGLSELLGELEKESDGETTRIRIAHIEPNRGQPRRVFDEEALQTLSESIRLHGVITPVVVRKLGEDRYQLIAGERRYRASRMAGLTELPARVLDVDEGEAYELALVENLQREDLDPIEEAEGYKVLVETYGLSQTEAAARVSKSRPAVANALRLLGLPEEIRAMVTNRVLSPGHARALLTVEGEKNRLAAAKILVQKEMTVRQAERFCKNFGKEKEPVPSPDIDYAKDLSLRLTRTLGRKVGITCNRGRGTVVLHYSDLDDLDRLLEQIAAKKEDM